MEDLRIEKTERGYTLSHFEDDKEKNTLIISNDGESVTIYDTNLDWFHETSDDEFDLEDQTKLRIMDFNKYQLLALIDILNEMKDKIEFV